MKHSTATLLMMCALTACAPASTGDAGTQDATPFDTGVAPADGSSETDAASGSDATAGGDASDGITLLSVSLVVHGTMQVRWANPTPACDQVTIERASNGAMFVTATTVTGSATSVRDMPGHQNGTYCYRALCVRGGAPSAPSNELCAMQ